MLQQTRVDTVVPFFERFIMAFPTVSALAGAPLDDVLALWSGLGYYSRARNLHKAAKLIVDDHGGEVPAEPLALRALPGIGPYTAGAIGSIAFGQPVPLVDGNVIRVLTRVFDIDQDVGQKRVQTHLWDIAATLVPVGRASEFNQGMMELGALVCTPVAPRCSVCPWHHRCLAYRAGVQQSRPIKGKKAKPRHQDLVSVVIMRNNSAVWLTKRPEKGLFGGMWEVPSREISPDDDQPHHVVARELVDQLGGDEVYLTLVGTVKHTLTHRRLVVHIFGVDWERVADPSVTGVVGLGRWVTDEGDFRSLGIGTLTRKILQLAAGFVEGVSGKR